MPGSGIGLALALGLAACAGRSFDNPLDPDNPAQGITTISVFDPPGLEQPAGMDFDDEELFVVDTRSSALVRIRASDGVASFRAALGYPAFGVADDGNFVWLTQTGAGTIVRVDPFRPEPPVQAPIPTPGGDPRGIAFHDELLWVLDANRTITTIDPATGATGPPIDVSAAIQQAGGLTFRDEEMWVIDRRDSRLVRLSSDGSAIEAFQLPTGGAVGLTTDGDTFYYSDDSGRIHHIELLED